MEYTKNTTATHLLYVHPLSNKALKDEVIFEGEFFFDVDRPEWHTTKPLRISKFGSSIIKVFRTTD